MEDNGTYRYPPQGSPKPPKKTDFKKLSRIAGFKFYVARC